MNLDGKQESCAVCHAYLFEEDDVVYCPVCGAPHHRECYNSLGHCGLEESHGTDMQYDKVRAQTPPAAAEQEKSEENQIVCPACKTAYPKSSFVCPGCGTPNVDKFGGRGVTVLTLDPLGGVPADTDIGGGVTAEQAKRLVAANTGRYIPKFAKMAAGFKGSFNWLAFFFPAPWLLSRKMYKAGALVAALSIAFSLLGIPLSLVSAGVDTSSAASYLEAYELLARYMLRQPAVILIAAAVGSVFDLLLRLIVGFRGDYMYYKYAVSSVKYIKGSQEDDEVAFGKRGGVSFLWMTVGYLAVWMLPQIIATFVS